VKEEIIMSVNLFVLMVIIASVAATCGGGTGGDGNGGGYYLGQIYTKDSKSHGVTQPRNTPHQLSTKGVAFW
jgi:hypothetical protein